ncbi:Na+/H+ antiporter family protein [Campylobacter hyointestinalis]|uniref:TRAP transporter large permease subunit n=1 Tax=Campylobacter hyointestinalis subsp. lawsonii TaxID=91353 RepID=A0AAV6EFF0_CAMHY|nr:Na+/H+ antiporter NhaC family protein [Campylobacter hyointestinalis]ANE33448.1 Na+/H+ antiporter family protein [Campylobacter hyointestinalis subsp. lawsonii CCUG 27631]KAB0613662.1 TRAP transporter large permease subunit [Campylobacter hyointestinalis subsp. lawsonii]QKF68669.1 YuiF family protein, putative amino acid transporter [Campylobacter hyointestinalis subsp. lawsonii]RAZ24235.1 sodium:proton antiporter [Campylobacter hyointestinalis subsp. lawsonii]RAZ28539.1 sodium:proton antip
MLLTNSVVLSVLLMCVLCLLRFNVFLAILISALAAGMFAGKGLVETTNLLITGMQGNLETALSYILLGTLAAAISMTNLTPILIHYVSKFISKKVFWFSLSIAFIACFSQNLIPVHIAFIPILIPPLLALMNKLRIDRRAVACALTFGLQAPYVSISVGFGLLFHTILKKELGNNGINVEIGDISSVMWIGGVAMLIGLVLALFYYRKPRDYMQSALESKELKVAQKEDLHMGQKEWVVLGGAVIAFGVQIWSSSLPLGALLGLIVMIIFGGIEYKKMDKVMEQGLAMMAFIAFIMLVAAGFGSVIRETGGINELINFASSIGGGKLGGAIIMLVIGLLVTMGIGTSFGTIPIIAAIYVPLCVSLGFSVPATILLVGIAAALGDAGSPASDSTLGPTSGLNADGKHSHIYDTCVPTFIFFNIPLIVFGVACSLFI